MGESWRGEAHDLPGGLVADHVEMVLQRGVLRALEIHQLGGLIDPDLCQERGLRDRQGQALPLCQPRTHTDHDRAAQGPENTHSTWGTADNTMQ